MLALLVFQVLLFFSFTNGIFTIEKKTNITYRLPTALKPMHYDITLEPFFNPQFTFNGKVSIEIDVVDNTSTVILHGKDLIIDESNIRIKEKDATEYVTVTDLKYDSTTMFYSINLEQNLRIGSIVVIEIDYTGILHNDNKGFYRASYEQDKITKWFATTKFKPSNARRAFPCFDEPSLKATFTIHIIRPDNYQSISNMRLTGSTQLDDNRFKDNFEKSKPMSTYLVAFVISQMTAVIRDNHAVYAPKDLIYDDKGDYALKASINILRALEDYTYTAYSLNNIYQVAIPNQYLSAEYMENWGLVTYKETMLMYKEGVATSAERQSTLSVIAHAYAHQWFGNLVTPSWWSYLWLSEGFAKHFEWFIIDTLEPSFRMMDQFVVSTLQYALETDALESTRAMSAEVQTTSEIESLFDSVIHDKYGSLIRMMEHFLTTSVYKRGIINYLKAMSFKSVQSSDLWTAMQNAVDIMSPNVLEKQLVADIMESWISQPGYPVVTLTRNVLGTITFSQERFFLNNSTDDQNTTWIIPINYATSYDPNFETTTASYWLKTKSENTIHIANVYWIILNKQQTGFYRVNYDQHNWDLIIDYLNSDDWSNIHVLNRAQLIDDSFNLARSGRLNYDTALRLSMHIAKETDYVPITSFLRVISYLHNHIAASDIYYPLFKKYVRELLQEAYKKLGNHLTGDHLDIKNRLNVIEWLCKFGDEECLHAMQDKYTKIYESGRIEPDLQSAVYCGGMRLDYDSSYKWEFGFDKYDKSDEALERSRWISALGCSLNPAILRRALSVALSDRQIYPLRPSDVTALISAVYTSSVLGVDTTFDYIILNFPLFQERLTFSEISTVFNGVANRISSSEKLERFRNFISDQSTDVVNTYGAIFDQAVNTMQSNIEFYDAHIEEIGTFLTEKFGVSTTQSTETPVEVTLKSTTRTTSLPLTTKDPNGGGTYLFVSKLSTLLIILLLII